MIINNLLISGYVKDTIETPKGMLEGKAVISLKAEFEKLKGSLDQLDPHSLRVLKSNLETANKIDSNLFIDEIFVVDSEIKEKKPVSWEVKLQRACNNPAFSTQEQKMIRNFWKAQKEHNHKCVIPEDPFEIIKKESVPLVCAVSESQERGEYRLSMEDAHFHQEIEQGQLFGVFDGHGDKGRIAAKAADYFMENFSNELAENPDNITAVFQQSMKTISDQVNDMEGGCTSVVCFVDKKTNKVYTATLGDSEAKIFREVDGKMKGIPLSAVRDWKSTKDYRRAQSVHPEIWTDEKIENDKELSSKEVRYPYSRIGLNVSRAIGDWDYDEGISRKPKVSVAQLQAGDILVVACDGVWDFATDEEKLIEAMTAGSDELMAKNIVDHALKDCESTDNVTAMAIKFG